MTVDLGDLFEAHHTKCNPRMYAQRYEQYFARFRERPIRLLEIGVGGYTDPAAGGAGLRVWKQYFPKAQLYGIDIVDKSAVDEERIRTFQGSQSDPAFLRRVIDEAGPFDIVIDDGSHRNEDVITSFKVLFPALVDDGVYVVEDTHFAYVPSFPGWRRFAPGDTQPDEEGPRWATNGGSLDPNNDRHTMMGFFKRLTDCLSHQEFLHPGYRPNYFDLHTVGVHFYRNQIFVLKGDNTGPGNLFRDNDIIPGTMGFVGADIDSAADLGLQFPEIDDPTQL